MDGLEQRYRRDLQFLRVDFNTSGGQALAQRYGVHAHPIIVLIDRTGSVHTRMVGVPTPEHLEQAIAAIISATHPTLMIQGTADAPALLELTRQAAMGLTHVQLTTLLAGHRVIFSHSGELALRINTFIRGGPIAGGGS